MSASPKSGSGLPLPSFRPSLAPNPDGSPWWARTFRITNVRVVSQLFFFALFVFLLSVTWLSRLKGYPASLFLEVDPLVSFATALSTHTVYRRLWWALFLLVPTLLLGRVFCNWACPYGTLHQFTGWLFNIRNNKNRIDQNRYRPLYQTKYVLLGLFLVLALCGALQIGLLDPICLLVRTFTVAIIPAVDLGLVSLAGQGLSAASNLVFKPAAPEPRVFAGAWFVGALLVGSLARTSASRASSAGSSAPSGRSSASSRAGRSGGSTATSRSARTATSASRGAKARRTRRAPSARASASSASTASTTARKTP
jgi:hypothetical protein